jgi:uncharacterized protein YukE
LRPKRSAGLLYVPSNAIKLAEAPRPISPCQGGDLPVAKANVDPTELRRFARDLSHFSAELQGLMTNLHGRMRKLEENWRDQEQRRFAEEFDQTVKTLTRFVKASEAHVAFLNKKASYIEEYLQH